MIRPERKRFSLGNGKRRKLVTNLSKIIQQFEQMDLKADQAKEISPDLETQVQTLKRSLDFATLKRLQTRKDYNKKGVEDDQKKQPEWPFERSKKSTFAPYSEDERDEGSPKAKDGSDEFLKGIDEQILRLKTVRKKRHCECHKICQKRETVKFKHNNFDFPTISLLNEKDSIDMNFGNISEIQRSQNGRPRRISGKSCQYCETSSNLKWRGEGSLDTVKSDAKVHKLAFGGLRSSDPKSEFVGGKKLGKRGFFEPDSKSRTGSKNSGDSGSKRNFSESDLEEEEEGLRGSVISHKMFSNNYGTVMDPRQNF